MHVLSISLFYFLSCLCDYDGCEVSLKFCYANVPPKFYLNTIKMMNLKYIFLTTKMMHKILGKFKNCCLFIFL